MQPYCIYGIIHLWMETEAAGRPRDNLCRFALLADRFTPILHPQMRKGIAIVVLLCMTLHCASRLGFISYLYSQRHQIAYSLGLISEIPIAICGPDYFASQAPLVIQDTAEDDQNLPASLSSAREVQLFLQLSPNHIFDQTGTDLNHSTEYQASGYPPPVVPFFHPPAVI